MTEHTGHYAMPQPIEPANTDHVRRKMLDIPYADRSPTQQLDIYLPDEGHGPFPVIVSIHGGAFMGGDKADAQVLPMLAGLQRGYAIVAINYRLSWEAPFPALVHDARAAIRWIRANAPQYGFDPGRIATWGGSAGGYLSLFAGISAGVEALEDLTLGNPAESSGVQAVVAWFPPTDFLKMDEQLVAAGLPPRPGEEHSGPNSPESLLLGVPITTVPDLVRAANPETYITPSAPPFLVQHGTADNVVPAGQSISFTNKLQEVIGAERCALDLLEGAGHADPRFNTPGNVARVLDFLDRVLRDQH